MDRLAQWLYAPLTASNRHVLPRQSLWVQGDEDFCQQHVCAVLAQLPTGCQYLWLGPAPASVTAQPLTQYPKSLGRAYDIVIYNAFAGFKPNALLAVAGTLKHGGTLVLISPAADHWAEVEARQPSAHYSHGFCPTHSRYIAALVILLSQQQQLAILSAKQGLITPIQDTASKAPSIASMPVRVMTAEQQQAFTAIIAAAQQKISCVVTGRRGRGKSTLLAFLCAEWLQQGANIQIVSLHKHNVEHLLENLAELHSIQQHQRHHWHSSVTGATVSWLAPDNPKLQLPSNDTLIIDEAAALPLPVLMRILVQRQWCVLSSTTEGYEGSAQGFTLRIQEALSKRYRQTPVTLTLRQPLRWSQNDTLEPLWDKLCSLTDWPTPTIAAHNAHLWFSSDNIPIATAQQAMKLLAFAHYQSTPNDLKRLLDAPDTGWLLYYRGFQLIGIVLYLEEGGAALQPLSEAIAKGTRRVKGHMSAQMLSHYFANPALATTSYWRIHRIVVHPDWQRRGIGSELLQRLETRAKQQGIQILATVYGETETLAAFWQQQGFGYIRHGQKENKASGTHSVLRIKRPD